MGQPLFVPVLEEDEEFQCVLIPLVGSDGAHADLVEIRLREIVIVMRIPSGEALTIVGVVRTEFRHMEGVEHSPLLDDVGQIQRVVGFVGFRVKDGERPKELGQEPFRPVRRQSQILRGEVDFVADLETMVRPTMLIGFVRL